jgi:hypothetical protein
MSGGTGMVGTGLPAASALSIAAKVSGPTRPSTPMPSGKLEGAHSVPGRWSHDAVKIELGAGSQPVEAVLKPDAVPNRLGAGRGAGGLAGL